MSLTGSRRQLQRRATATPTPPTCLIRRFPEVNRPMPEATLEHRAIERLSRVLPSPLLLEAIDARLTARNVVEALRRAQGPLIMGMATALEPRFRELGKHVASVFLEVGTRAVEA